MNCPKQRYTGEKPWMDKAWLYDQYVIQDKSTRMIASEYGCKQNTIQHWLINHGIKKEIKTHNMTHTKSYQNANYLYTEHIINRKSVAMIAKENSVDHDTIRYFMNKYNIQMWQTNPPAKFTDDDISIIMTMYFDDKISAYAISKLFKCSHRTIIDMIRSYGKQTRTLQESQFASNKNTIDGRLNDSEWLNKKFWDDELSSKEIGEILGVNASTIIRQMHRLGLNTNRRQKKTYKIKGIEEYIPSEINSLTNILRDYFRVNIRPSVLLRDNHKCQKCGSTSNLHVHHIQHFDNIINEIIHEHPELNINLNSDLIKMYLIIRKDQRFLSMDNVITLCKDCHHTVHNMR